MTQDVVTLPREHLRAAYDALCKAAGTALGVAISGKAHPNPDEVLTEVFHACTDASEAVRLALKKEPE